MPGAVVLALVVVRLVAAAGFVDIGNVPPSVQLAITAQDQNEENGLIVKKIDDNLTLSCSFVNYNNTVLPLESNELKWLVPFQSTNRSKTIWAENDSFKLSLDFLQPSDAGQYTCTAPMMSDLKAYAFVAVRPLNVFGFPYCSPSMFSCGDALFEKTGAKCIPTTYLCDGRSDCPYPSRDEAFETCGTNNPCTDKLLCGDGRCIPKSWCCVGRKDCLPHPCCTEHMQDDFGLVKTGGGLRKNPNESLLLQATLFKACACLFVIITTITILISAICRARLKRISNSRSRMGMPSPESLEPHAADCLSASPVIRNGHYSLVHANDGNSNLEVLNQNHVFPPAYTEHVTETTQSRTQSELQSGLPNSSTFNQVRTADPESNVVNSSGNEDNTNSANNSPVRRPNDFGMGFLANSIFNSRYQSVPQHNLEISPLDYVTDSDSSCRSPAIHTPNNALNLGTLEFNSHFYGERIGIMPDVNILRGLSENRRLRHSNALDRILDRFGLHAPYNVDINREYNQSLWECQTFISPPIYENDANRHRHFLSSFWANIKNKFNRNRSNERPDRSDVNQTALPENRSNNNNHQRRRPDTPDVPESTYSDLDTQRLTSLLRGNGEYELYGGAFTHVGYFQPRSYTLRDYRHVSPHNFPPPYSQYAVDPPPPYMSHENLLNSRTNLQNTIHSISDQNGNNLTINEVSNSNDIDEGTINNNMDNNILNINLELSDATGTISVTGVELIEPTVAFDRCDDNGNVNCATFISQSQNLDSLMNSNNLQVLTNCSNCSENKKCNEHKNLICPSFKSDNLLIRNHPNKNVLSDSNQNKAVNSVEDPSTSLSHFLSENNNLISEDHDTLNSNIDNSKRSSEDQSAGMNVSMDRNENICIDENALLKEASSSKIETEASVLDTDQNICISVPSRDPPSVESSPIEETHRMTDESGFIFDPHSLEFIDSIEFIDCNVDYG